MAKKPGYDQDKLRKVFANLRDAITKLDIDAYKEIAEYTKNRIVSKARQGKHVEDGKEKKLPDLSPLYIKQRKKIAENQHGKLFRRLSTDKDQRNLLKTDPDAFRRVVDARAAVDVDPTFFSPARANNTLTGEFMKSIRIEKMDQKTGEIVISPNDDTRKGGKLTNSTLSGYLKKMGRSIFAIDDTARKVLLSKLKSKVRDQIRKNLLRK